MKRYLHSALFLFLALSGALIFILHNADQIDAWDPWTPAPGVFNELTAKELQDKAAELEATKDIDRQVEVSRGCSRAMTMEAPAYCLTTPTYAGDKTGIGVVAADPEVIPLYSRIWIEGYGYGTVLDTGKNIQGNRIDVWLPTGKNARPGDGSRWK